VAIEGEKLLNPMAFVLKAGKLMIWQINHYWPVAVVDHTGHFAMVVMKPGNPVITGIF
jgi:hypothetical protein